MEAAPGVLEFYAGRDILVTGATGFMGKVLLEKLLRSCPDLHRVYILVRPKRGLSPAARVHQMTTIPVFERLLKECPEALSRICPLEGDVGADNLGLSPEDQQRVLEDVSVVFHMAASLSFKSPLKEAVDENTTGTKRVLDFCCQIKNLVSFVYVSTTFCNCEYEVLEERVYKPQVDPHYVMRICQEMDDETVNHLTPKLLGRHPNCYTFTKLLAEALVDEYHHKMPLSIARPSIVTAALREPMPGWVDSLNGPTGILVAAGKGVLRSMMCNANHHAEVIPVDICINALILVACKRPQLTQEETARTPVYNISSNNVERVTWGEVFEIGRRNVYENPFETILWYPDGGIRTNWLAHTLIVFFFQHIPAYFVDLLLFLAGQKTFMIRVQKRITAGLAVLQYFTMRDWDFRNDKAWALWPSLNARDKEIFFINNVTPVDREKYIKTLVLGSRTYCCKEPLESLPRSRRNIKMYYFLHQTCVTLFYIACGWLLYRALTAHFGLVRSWTAILGQVATRSP